MQEAFAIGLFAVVLALVASEKLNRTKSALLGAAVAAVGGLLSQEEAIAAIDWGVLGLLAGMMVLVWGAERSGVFTYLAIRVGQASKGEPLRLMAGLTGTTAVASAFLDNVTTILLVIPITLVIADALELDAVPLVIAEIIASNLGGAATLIGDPPNIIIAGRSGLGFTDFLVHVGPPAVAAYLLVTAGIYLAFRGRLRPDPDRVADLATLDAAASLAPRREVVVALGSLGITILGFFVHGAIGLEPATVALSGAVLYMLASRVEVEEPLAAIEWGTLFFFLGLFVVVGALEVNGVLERVADLLADTTSGSPVGEAMAILWGSAIASGLVDNIPFTAAMVPVVEELSRGDDANWWALSIGACYGGNLTLIAASANLVGAGMLRRTGRHLSFTRFLAVGVPATLASMAVATAWILLVEV
ncbi:MAG: ArsB/NhaD family transporter [Thermoleophilia bacterium]